MSASDFAALIADSQTPAPSQPAALQYGTPILGLHSIQETMFTTTRNTFWLPSSLRHGVYTSRLYGKRAIQEYVLNKNTLHTVTQAQR